MPSRFRLPSRTAARALAAFGLLAIATAPALAATEPAGRLGDNFAGNFGFYDPMYIAFYDNVLPGTGEVVDVAQFQISFRYLLLSFVGADRPAEAPTRGLSISYTQTSFWDLSSRSQPFYESNYKPGVFVLWQQLDEGRWSWVERLDLEGGYRHHSNGRDGEASRFVDMLYLRSTFSWRLFGMSRLFVVPSFWTYFGKSPLNDDIAEYWGHLDLELTWRADFGLQLETHMNPGSSTDRGTFTVAATYPLNRLWRPLNLYLWADYFSGYGATILDYDLPGSGWAFGLALSR